MPSRRLPAFGSEPIGLSKQNVTVVVTFVVSTAVSVTERRFGVKVATSGLAPPIAAFAETGTSSMAARASTTNSGARRAPVDV